MLVLASLGTWVAKESNWSLVHTLVHTLLRVQAGLQTWAVAPGWAPAPSVRHRAAKFSQAGEAILGPSAWQQGFVSLQGPAQYPRRPPGLWAYKAGLADLKCWSL